MSDDLIARCEICGEPMPAGEDMFKFHGYSGPCPKPPLPREPTPTVESLQRELAAERARADAAERDAERRLAQVYDALPWTLHGKAIIANLCDEEWDKSGALLGRIRNLAAAIDAASKENPHDCVASMAQSAQPAAVGAKLSDAQRNRLYRAISDARGLDTIFAEVEYLLASARAAGMESAAKICEQVPISHAFKDTTTACATAIRAAIRDTP